MQRANAGAGRYDKIIGTWKTGGGYAWRRWWWQPMDQAIDPRMMATAMAVIETATKACLSRRSVEIDPNHTKNLMLAMVVDPLMIKWTWASRPGFGQSWLSEFCSRVGPVALMVSVDIPAQILYFSNSINHI